MGCLDLESRFLDSVLTSLSTTFHDFRGAWKPSALLVPLSGPQSPLLYNEEVGGDVSKSPSGCVSQTPLQKSRPLQVSAESHVDGATGLALPTLTINLLHTHSRTFEAAV